MKNFVSNLGATLLDFTLAAATYLAMFLVLNILASQIFISIYLVGGLTHGLLLSGLLVFIRYLPHVMFWSNAICLVAAIGGYFIILRPVVWWALRVDPAPSIKGSLTLTLAGSSLILSILILVWRVWVGSL